MSRDTPDERTASQAPSSDDDLRALFDAQAARAVVPPELDASIRAAAREAASDGRRLPDATPATPSDTAASRPAVTRRSVAPRWLAAAAVVVLAVALLPVLRQAPETTAVPERARAPASPLAADATDVAGEAPVSAEREAAPASSPSPAAGSERKIARSRAMEPLSSFAAPESVAGAVDPFDGYRRTATVWLERLRERLRADGLTPALRAEFTRFRAIHPDVEPAFDPAAVAREGAAGRR